MDRRFIIRIAMPFLVICCLVLIWFGTSSSSTTPPSLSLSPETDNHHNHNTETKNQNHDEIKSSTATRNDNDHNEDQIMTTSSSSLFEQKKPTLQRKTAAAVETFWNMEEPLFDQQAAKEDRMKLSSETFTKLQEKSDMYHQLGSSPDKHNSLASLLREKKCNPERFIFVNTHTFGRHHNQLQEVLHIIAFARKLDRTAVLGHFRANHKWWGPSEFYDFELLLQRECVVTPAEFKGLWNAVALAKKRKKVPTTPTAVCLGQGTKATPMSKYVKCTMEPSVPAHYNSKTGFGSTKDVFYGKMIKEKKNIAEADFLGVSGEIAFFMRPGIVEMSRLLGSIKPSMSILGEIKNFYRSSKLTMAPEVEKFWYSSSSSSPVSSEILAQHHHDKNREHHKYFALHLRQRERDCLKEVNDALELNPDLLRKLSSAQASAIRTQCAIPVSHVNDNLMTRYQITPSKTKFFLASDRENKVLEKALIDNNDAKMYAGQFEHKSLQGLAMDFFLLVGAEYFSGNQLSSISQNVCMMRLGLGMTGCQGCVLDYALQLYNPIDEV